jgi:hypothetical protein
LAGFYGSSTELTYGTKFPNDARLEIAMDKVIHLINPSRNPFLVLANIIGKTTVPQPKFEWMEDENFISRHFKATVVLETYDTSYDAMGIQLHDPRDWQAIEAISNESGYHTAGSEDGRDVFIKITDGTNVVAGYIKKSAIVNGKTRRQMTKDGSTATGSGVYFTNLIQVTYDDNDIGTASNDCEIEVVNDSDNPFTEEEVDCYVYTPNFVQAYDEYGWEYGGFKEGSGTIPDTRKTVANYANYTQIFKTSLQVTGTMQGTTAFYGGPERARLRAKKAMQHASDIEWAVMFNQGGTEGTDWGVMDSSENPRRVFKGLGVGAASASVAGWIATYNGAYNTDMQLAYADGDYDDMVAITEKLFDDTDAGSETKIVYGSKKWLTKFSKIFYEPGDNVVVSTQIGNLSTKAGLRISSIRTAHGDLVIASHPFLRGPYEDYAVILDPKNIALCPLNSRDTKLRTNIQTPDLDGVMDEYLTEIGLKVMHENTHAILKLT